MAPDDRRGRVVAAVIARGPTFLVCKRPSHKRHGGLWEFPGGKCEDGETDDAALHRELGEELALSVTQVGTELFRTADPGSHFSVAFIPVDVVGEPACLEHEALAWRELSDLIHLPLAPSDEKFVSYLIERSPPAGASRFTLG